MFVSVVLLAAVAVLAEPVRAQPVPGDTNCDGQITEADMDLLIARLYGEDGVADCGNFDVNRDHLVSAADVVLLGGNLNSPRGPQISYLGVARTDGVPVPPLGTLPDGTIVYHRTAGIGFQIVVEGVLGASHSPIGLHVLDSVANNPNHRPDLQIESENTLGDGSTDVCDDFGVPALNPPDFSYTMPIANALNDLSCRAQVTTTKANACTQDRFGQATFVNSASKAQFCIPVDSAIALPLNDTTFAVQLRDQAGNLGGVQHMIVRVINGPMPPTFTPAPPTETTTPTATSTDTRTPTVTRTSAPTRTRTSTRTANPVPTRTPSRATSPVTPSVTPTPPVGTATRTPSRTPTGSPTRTGTQTRTPSRTPSPTFSGTPTRTVPPAATGTRTRTPTRSPVPSPTGPRGPIITFFGITGPSDALVDPTTPGTIPVYERRFGCSFSFVVEVMKRGPQSIFNIDEDTFVEVGCPGLQIQSTNPLGAGSSIVCGQPPDDPGGVPGINPPDLSDTPVSCNQFNDLGCLFDDGQMHPQARTCSNDSACIRFGTGLFGCKTNADRQFCGAIDSRTSFPPGDSLVTARVQDTSGNLSDPVQLIIHSDAACQPPGAAEAASPESVAPSLLPQ